MRSVVSGIGFKKMLLQLRAQISLLASDAKIVLAREMGRASFHGTPREFSEGRESLLYQGTPWHYCIQLWETDPCSLIVLEPSAPPLQSHIARLTQRCLYISAIRNKEPPL